MTTPLPQKQDNELYRHRVHDAPSIATSRRSFPGMSRFLPETDSLGFDPLHRGRKNLLSFVAEATRFIPTQGESKHQLSMILPIF
jgi:hypothetical protein